MSLFTRDSSNRFGIFPYVITVSIVSVLFAGFATWVMTSGDKMSTAIFTGILALFIIIFLLITRELWMESKSKLRVRLATVGIALTTIIAYTGWQQTIQDVLAKYLLIENFGNAVHPAIVFSFSAFVIFVINYFNRDNTAMGIHPNPIDIPEPDFISRMVMVTESLTEDLKTIDKTTNWSIQFFTPLDAEVELRSEGSETQKKVTDLLKAIKSMKRERLFLVLGDPGSGKSVALRKLCRELASEVIKTKKIPVYINLKEWQVEQKWDENNPPTVEQLNEFVLKNLKSGDIVKTNFFKKYYDTLYENGQLYFIFDSFDEIPSVLDEKDKSPLIQQLSNVMFKFLKGARQDSQGILSSRIFRKPTEDFQTQTTLEIRPFSDEKIEQTLRRSNQFSDELLKQLFKERTDLVPVARNPFMSALIANYAENNHNPLPRNQSDLYESYIHNALKSCHDSIQKRGLTEGMIIQSAIAMADTMFRNYGLEAPIKELKQKLNVQNLEETIEILKFARIGRVGTGDENMFSFTHRRFCEYFAVQKLLQDNREFDLNTIPEDSQWRDALVLYCEVADETKSQKIANFCWNIIKNSTNAYDLRVIHSLRFLQDAFKGRLECIVDFRKELTDYVLSRINRENIIITKLAVESLGLMKDTDIEKGVVQAFDLRNEWINETAFKACRHLDEISIETKKCIIKYIQQMPMNYTIKRHKEISFSLNLSSAFKGIYRYLNLKFFDYSIVFIVTFFCLFFALNIEKNTHIITNILIALLITGFTLTIDFKQKEVNVSELFDLLPISYMNTQKLIAIMCLFGLYCSETNVLVTNSLTLSINQLMSHTYFALFFIFSTLFLMFPIHNIFQYFFLKNFSVLKNIKQIIKSIKQIRISSLKRIIINEVIPFIVIMSTIFMSGYLIYYIMKNYKFELFFLKSFTFLFIILWIMRIYITLSRLYFDYFFFKTINLKKCNNRVYISEIYPKFRSLKYKKHFLKYLENNVRQVIGDWQDPKILMLDNSEETIRLAKLEEKWLGLNK